MGLISDFTIAAYENGTLTVGVVPPTPIGGWPILFQMMGRAYGTVVIQKSMASGFYGYASGMTIVDSGRGVFNVQFNPAESSGLDLIRGTWFYRITNQQSGSVAGVVEGYRVLPP